MQMATWKHKHSQQVYDQWDLQQFSVSGVHLFTVDIQFH